MKLDATDFKILTILQTDGRITNAQLASQIGISTSATLERVKRLEKSGTIRQFVALVDPNALSQHVFAMVSISLTIHQLKSIDEFTDAINQMDEVLECYHISGEDDFLLKVIVHNISAYEEFMLQKITRLPGINKIKTAFVLSTFKYQTKIPVN